MEAFHKTMLTKPWADKCVMKTYHDMPHGWCSARADVRPNRALLFWLRLTEWGTAELGEREEAVPRRFRDHGGVFLEGAVIHQRAMHRNFTK